MTAMTLFVETFFSKSFTNIVATDKEVINFNDPTKLSLCLVWAKMHTQH